MEESFGHYFLKASLWIKIKLTVLAFCALGIAGAGLFTCFGIFKLYWAGSKIVELEEKRESVTRQVAAFTKSYEVAMISIPLVNRSTTRIAYAQFSLTFDCPNERSYRAMELNRAKLLDTIYTVASNFYLEDFDSTNGIQNFKKSLISSYNKYFRELAPRRLTINDWVIN